MESRIQLAHGGGGRLTAALIAEEILPRFGGGPLDGLPDAASLPWPCDGGLVFTTDSFVVQPIFFPGGDIGTLAVHGTVNDLAVSGAAARWLSLSMILEEGLPLADLRRVLDSVAAASRACGVQVATGDTKVVPRGQCDRLYLNTAGIGQLLPGYRLSADSIQPGDRVLVSGTLGDHGLAVLAAREGVGEGRGLRSDSAPVVGLVEAVGPLASRVRWMRDPTRGGLAAALNECVRGRPWGIRLSERDLPVAPATAALADLLGLDVLQSPCEGRIVLVCAPDAAADILAIWRQRPDGRMSADIGEVTANNAGAVVLDTRVGGRRLVDMPLGEMLPRIC